MKKTRGRPQLYPDGSKKFRVVLPYAVGAAIEKKAKALGLSGSQYLRQIILERTNSK
jgi:hypothetical protein